MSEDIMTEPDSDLVPPRPRGRPMRHVENGMATATGVRNVPRCRRCEKHDPRRVWCPIKASVRSGESPMCRYGLVLYGLARRNARRAGGKGGRK